MFMILKKGIPYDSPRLGIIEIKLGTDGNNQEKDLSKYIPKRIRTVTGPL